MGKWFRLLQSSYEGQYPPHIAAKDDSWIKIYGHEEWKNLPADKKCAMVCNFHVYIQPPLCSANHHPTTPCDICSPKLTKERLRPYASLTELVTATSMLAGFLAGFNAHSNL